MSYFETLSEFAPKHGNRPARFVHKTNDGCAIEFLFEDGARWYERRGYSGEQLPATWDYPPAPGSRELLELQRRYHTEMIREPEGMFNRIKSGLPTEWIPERHGPPPCGHQRMQGCSALCDRAALLALKKRMAPHRKALKEIEVELAKIARAEARESRQARYQDYVTDRFEADRREVEFAHSVELEED